MGYTTTFDDLTDEMATYCEDDTDEFELELPNIIKRAEDKIRSELNLDLFVTFDDFEFTIATNIFDRPDGVKIDGFFLDSNAGIVERRSADFCLMHGGTGKPKYFGEYSEAQIIVAPTPDVTYQGISKCLTRLESLSATVQTNWISDNCADLLLWAALIESEKFLLAPERISEFKDSFRETMDLRKNELRGLARGEYLPSLLEPQAPQPQTQG